MPIDSASLRDTLRFWGSGVSIVTTALHDAGGTQIAGMTVSAFNSLSLDPPMILTCLNKEATTVQLLLRSNILAVSILGSEQAELSERFAGRKPLQHNEDRFAGVPVFTAFTGAPILRDALAWLDCGVKTIHDGSTHWIVIGEVMAAGHHDLDTLPLFYFNRGYHTIDRSGMGGR